MRYPKLTFYTSANSNLNYKIFRFQNENKDYSIDYYINNKSNLSLSEITTNSTSTSLKDYPLTIVDIIEGDNDFFFISAPFDIVRNISQITINLKNNPNGQPYRKIRTTFGENVISKIEYIEGTLISKVIVNPILISKLIKVENNNTLLLNRLEFNSNSCSIDVDIKQLSIIDKDAHGIFEPTVSIIETKDYILFYQDIKTHKNRYYYKSIGINDKNVSEISDSKVIDVAEPAEKIKTIAESCDNYTSENQIWTLIQGDYSPNSEVKVYKSKNEIASNIIPTIYEHEINIDDHLLASDATRTIRIPNIWHYTRKHIMERPKKAFRFKNISIENKNIETEYSEPITFYDTIEILIDKMIIYKKNVTGMPKDIASLPITPQDINAKPIKIYIRQGGIYYKDYLSSEYETNNIDNDKDITSLITMDARFPLLTIKDNCIYSNVYNYTVYLYDETGNISNPISIIA